MKFRKTSYMVLTNSSPIPILRTKLVAPHSKHFWGIATKLEKTWDLEFLSKWEIADELTE